LHLPITHARYKKKLETPQEQPASAKENFFMTFEKKKLRNVDKEYSTCSLYGQGLIYF